MRLVCSRSCEKHGNSSGWPCFDCVTMCGILVGCAPSTFSRRCPSKRKQPRYFGRRSLHQWHQHGPACLVSPQEIHMIFWRPLLWLLLLATISVHFVHGNSTSAPCLSAVWSVVICAGELLLAADCYLTSFLSLPFSAFHRVRWLRVVVETS